MLPVPKGDAPPKPKGRPEQIAALLRTYRETERRLRGLGGSEVEAALLQSLPSVLLYEAQEKLRESEERFHSLFTAAAIAIGISTPQGRFLHVNQAYCAMLGYTEPEMLQRNFAELTHPDDLHLNLELRDEVLAGVRQSFVMEKRYIKKSGEIVWTRHSVSATHNDAAEIATLLVIAEDITERKRVEEELARKQARYERLVDSNVQGVMFWHREGRITGANDAFLRIVGQTREALEAGQVDWKALTPAEYVYLDQRCLEELDAKGIGTPYEKEYVLPDGRRVPVLLGAAAFADDPNEGVCFVLDLTERKRLEQQYLRAQRMESVGRLAGGVAHDLNNVLTPILIGIDLLKTRLRGGESQAVLETIEVSAKRGASIVGQMLSFTRGVQSERSAVHLEPLLAELVKIIQDTFPKDVRTQTRVAADLWTMYADATQVHQVLLNLCVNARDAMPHGGRLTIMAENCVVEEQRAPMGSQGGAKGGSQAKPGRYVRINVTDTGTGMAADTMAKIFEPFFTTKELNKGTGLGLSTVLAIVQGHEGMVNVYSEPGRGTTFRVDLPAVGLPGDAGKDTTDHASLTMGRGETVLLVDDESSIVSIIGAALQGCGYRVLTAADGAEGVAVYAGNLREISVVVTDLTMPVMGGAAMIHALRRMNPGVKAIAASGLHANGSDRAALAGVEHFLTKPYTLSTLLAMLRRVLDEAPVC
jgi:PAS domain S-box-containing protein